MVPHNLRFTLILPKTSRLEWKTALPCEKDEYNTQSCNKTAAPCVYEWVPKFTNSLFLCCWFSPPTPIPQKNSSIICSLVNLWGVPLLLSLIFELMSPSGISQCYLYFPQKWVENPWGSYCNLRLHDVHFLEQKQHQRLFAVQNLYDSEFAMWWLCSLLASAFSKWNKTNCTSIQMHLSRSIKTVQECYT